MTKGLEECDYFHRISDKEYNHHWHRYIEDELQHQFDFRFEMMDFLLVYDHPEITKIRFYDF
jgi:hypothetical protein